MLVTGGVSESGSGMLLLCPGCPGLRLLRSAGPRGSNGVPRRLVSHIQRSRCVKSFMRSGLTKFDSAPLRLDLTLPEAHRQHGDQCHPAPDLKGGRHRAHEDRDLQAWRQRSEAALCCPPVLLHQCLHNGGIE